MGLLPASATFPSKTLLIFNPSCLASLVVIKQSLLPVSSYPFNCTLFIVTFINECLRILVLQRIEFDFSNVANRELSVACCLLAKLCIMIQCPTIKAHLSKTRDIFALTANAVILS